MVRGPASSLPTSIVPIGTTDKTIVVRRKDGALLQTSWIPLANAMPQLPLEGDMSCSVSVVMFGARTKEWEGLRNRRRRGPVIHIENADK